MDTDGKRNVEREGKEVRRIVINKKRTDVHFLSELLQWALKPSSQVRKERKTCREGERPFMNTFRNHWTGCFHEENDKRKR